jgi:hypothetical protein
MNQHNQTRTANLKDATDLRQLMGLARCDAGLTVGVRRARIATLYCSDVVFPLAVVDEFDATWSGINDQST